MTEAGILMTACGNVLVFWYLGLPLGVETCKDIAFVFKQCAANKDYSLFLNLLV
jgi:hypothetical protein